MRAATSTRGRTSAAAHRGSISAARPSTCASASITSTACIGNGHEIASHAVGHFNGAGWSAADWDKEFRAFQQALGNVGPNNGLAETALAFPLSEVTGFRAPYLAKSPGLYAVLKSNGFRYDTSGVGQSDAWPEKIDGTWRFNLAMLRIAGSGKGTLSMDYNFFVAHSRAVSRSAPL